MRQIMYSKHRKKLNLDEWNEIVCPIISHPEYQKRKKFRHHGNVTVYDHSIKVSTKAYFIAKKLKMDYRSIAIAGLLHDFYETPWQDVIIKQPFFKKHAFSHAENALNNSRVYFKEYLNPIIENCILRHMFPINIIPPKYKEGIIITIVDKIVSIDMLLSKESILKTIGFVKRS